MSIGYVTYSEYVPARSSTSTPPSRRDEYKEATRRALVQSAVRLFSSKGFSDTTLSDVAARARVTKGAVYHHFESK